MPENKLDNIESQLKTDLTNAYTIGALTFWAKGDRIIIEEDAFKSGYECETCDGSGVTLCLNCDGHGENNGKKCSHCEGSGQTRCNTCEGKGGFLLVPEVSQRRPTTGRIVSVGSECKECAVGDSVMYSNFSGYVIDLERSGCKVVLRILHESEILCGMSGQFDLRSIRHKSDIATFQG